MVDSSTTSSMPYITTRVPFFQYPGPDRLLLHLLILALFPLLQLTLSSWFASMMDYSSQVTSSVSVTLEYVTCQASGKRQSRQRSFTLISSHQMNRYEASVDNTRTRGLFFFHVSAGQVAPVHFQTRLVHQIVIPQESHNPLSFSTFLVSTSNIGYIFDSRFPCKNHRPVLIYTLSP